MTAILVILACAAMLTAMVAGVTIIATIIHINQQEDKAADKWRQKRSK